MAASPVVAHVAGMPVEEVLSLALTAGGMASAAARVAWVRLRHGTQRGAWPQLRRW